MTYISKNVTNPNVKSEICNLSQLYICISTFEKVCLTVVKPVSHHIFFSMVRSELTCTGGIGLSN